MAAAPLTVKVLFFAAVREEAGASEASLELPAGSSTAAIVASVQAQYPQLERLLERCALALNGNYVVEPTPLNHGDEVALIPPLSGG